MSSLCEASSGKANCNDDEEEETLAASSDNEDESDIKVTPILLINMEIRIFFREALRDHEATVLS